MDLIAVEILCSSWSESEDDGNQQTQQWYEGYSQECSVCSFLTLPIKTNTGNESKGFIQTGFASEPWPGSRLPGLDAG
jgi:hypothetical protein